MNTTKVLIITYYWPPAGGPGVQRWLKFVKYLPEFGIEPIVYCPQNPNYPIIDANLVKDIPENITILKTPIKEPYKLAQFFSKKSTKKISSGVIPKKKKQSILERLMLYIRGNYFIPDARKNWIKPSVNYLSEYVKENEIGTVITTGPPHSLHLIGLQLKEKLNVNWLADFRDPWTTIGYHKALKLTASSKEKHIALEAEVLNKADKIIVTSHHTKNEFKTKTQQPIYVITNGYDVHTVRVEEKSEKFTLAHIGSLLSERNPLVLWEVLSELINENENFAKDFELQLIGVVSDDVLESIYNHNLKTHTKVLGYLSHKEAITYQLKSQLLLLIEIDSEDTKAIIPGKLFEYLSSKTPILAIGPKDSDIEQIIETTNAGFYSDYENREGLKFQIMNFYKSFKSGNLTSNVTGIEKYSRKNITKDLADILHFS